MQEITLKVADNTSKTKLKINDGSPIRMSLNRDSNIKVVTSSSDQKNINLNVHGEGPVKMTSFQDRIVQAVSPTIDLERVDHGVQITVSDITGVKSEMVYDGEKGQAAYTDTTENWNAKRSYIPDRGDIVIYTDYGHMDDGYGNVIDVPGIKIGDGNAYLIDLPFVGADVRYQILTELRAHSGNTLIHVTPEDRAFWNNKLNCTVNDGNLILNRL